MNKIYDLVVIGASREGLDILQELNSRTDKKFAIVDDNFANKLDSCLDSGIDTYERHVEYIEYKNGLIILFMDGKSDYIATTNLIIATGRKSIIPEKYVGQPNIYSNTRFIQKNEERQHAAVIGDDILAVKDANTLAGRYNQVYLIVDSMKEHFENKKLAENVSIVHNAKLADVIYRTVPKTGERYLSDIVLDNFSKIPCRALVFKNRLKNEIPAAAPGIITENDLNCIETKETHEVLNVPSIYAIGSCSDRSFDTADCAHLADKIIKDNKWEER